MKAGIYTVDLFPGREHLMPWRTVLETGRYLKKSGITTEIISVLKHEKTCDYEYKGLKVKMMNNNLKEVIEYINHNEFDVFLFQVKWRDGFKNLNILSGLKCRKIAYFDGGVYHLPNVFRLASTAGFRVARPYLLECLAPKFMILNKLKKYGFSNIIGLSEFTTSKVIKYGFPDAITIYPGHNFPTITSEAKNDRTHKEPKEKFFLFTGAPHLTRGSVQLLKAFDKFASVSPDAKMTFLMRTDAGSDFSAFNKELDKIRNRSKVRVIRQNLSQDELNTYFREAWGVILPFLVIPSEIPLTFFEVLSMGTPVITFNNGGTTAYLSGALAVSKSISINSLAKKMYELWTDEEYHSALSKNAVQLIRMHPNWEQSGQKWLNVITG